MAAINPYEAPQSVSGDQRTVVATTPIDENGPFRLLTWISVAICGAAFGTLLGGGAGFIIGGALAAVIGAGVLLVFSFVHLLLRYGKPVSQKEVLLFAAISGAASGFFSGFALSPDDLGIAIMAAAFALLFTPILMALFTMGKTPRLRNKQEDQPPDWELIRDQEAKIRESESS